MAEDKHLKDNKLAELKARRQKITEMGGKERVAADGRHRVAGLARILSV